MATQSTARAPAEPRIHVKIDEEMTQDNFKLLASRVNQQYNDQRHAMQPESDAIAAGLQFCGACSKGCAVCRVRTDNPSMIEGFEPIGIDSEGGGYD